VAGFLKRERRVLKFEFGVRVGFFEESFYHRIAKKELEKA
jgi:hypothetical protein